MPSDSTGYQNRRRVGRPRLAISVRELRALASRGLGCQAIAQELFDRGFTDYPVSPMTVWRRINELTGGNDIGHEG